MARLSDTLLDRLQPSPLKTLFLWKAAPSALPSSPTSVLQSATTAALAFVAVSSPLSRTPLCSPVLNRAAPSTWDLSLLAVLHHQGALSGGPQARDLLSDWSLASLSLGSNVQ